jgi:ribosomal protein L28
VLLNLVSLFVYRPIDVASHSHKELSHTQTKRRQTWNILWKMAFLEREREREPHKVANRRHTGEQNGACRQA